ncbi:hereditary hemochromatosis protein homolog isoform X2 [Aquarana catesbeiana]|uniref:hereditary hemochromatosis protein homolog isoform X2 n=1 Tax=Aquarana catesbeiana TaxID=8400 RepID=UPI003CC9B1F1
MKALFPTVTLSIYLFLSFKATSSFRLNWLQSFHMVDEELSYWSSMEMEGFQVAAIYNTPVLVFKQSWAKGNFTDDQWSLFDVFLIKYFSSVRKHILYYYEKLGGKDVTRKEWVEEHDLVARAILIYLKEDKRALNDLVVGVTKLCMQLADLFSETGKEVYSRKSQPQAYITSRTDQSETEVICMVTGFYPRSINVSLWKENKPMENVLSTETLPNGDGTYQITVSTTVKVIEQKSVYCWVEHSSFKEPLIVYLDKKPHSPTGLVVGLTVLAVVCVALTYFIKKYKKGEYNTII